MGEVKKLGFEYVALHSMLFPGIEMGNAPNDEQVGTVTRALKENELKPVDLVTFNGWHSLGLSGMMEQLPSSPSDPEYLEVRKRGVKQFARIAEVARALGCEQVFTLMGGRRLYHFDHEEAWVQSIGELIPALEKSDIRVSFMPHPGDFVEESDVCVDLVRSAGSRRVGYIYVMPHTFVLAGRMNADPGSMIEYAAKAGVLTEVHMADSLKPVQMWVRDHLDIEAYHSHLLPGKGSVDIAAALKSLVKIGFEGPMLFIPYRYGIDGASFAELAAEARHTVDAMLEGIGSGHTGRSAGRAAAAGRAREVGSRAPRGSTH